VGPLWGGAIRDREFLSAVMDELAARQLNLRAQAMHLALLCFDELDVPFHYDQHRLARKLGVSPIAMDMFLDNLRERGCASSRTHYSPVGFKTDAPIDVIREELRSGKKT
jgi:tRNA (guanine26-N2/guanine27-N2)-dimethyltransferase